MRNPSLLQDSNKQTCPVFALKGDIYLYYTWQQTNLPSASDVIYVFHGCLLSRHSSKGSPEKFVIIVKKKIIVKMHSHQWLVTHTYTIEVRGLRSYFIYDVVSLNWALPSRSTKNRQVFFWDLQRSGASPVSLLCEDSILSLPTTSIFLYLVFFITYNS